MDFHITQPDTALAADLQALIDNKTKPLGALGRLERLALQIGLIQQRLKPRLANPHIIVCAGDHGAARAGISAFPQEVTWQMVENFLAGGAAINVFARQAGIALTVVDAGVAHDFGMRPGLMHAKIGYGTANYLEGPAMSEAQCREAIVCGARIAADLHASGCDVVGFGEMGIGNTASASLLTHFLTGAPLAQCVGRGTGLDDAGLARKQALLEQAAARYQGEAAPLSVLARFGGFEIAMLCGAMLGAAERRMVLLIDGFIVTSALLVAAALHPAIVKYCVFSHRSQERGHRLQFEHLGVEPLLDLELRLGEGTGAALAYPIVKAAVAMLNEMASFQSAGVSEKLES
jgi:nicotinate-nucleotide--dimethylbenzimidazole phosphoribosyltransferase